MKTRWSIKLFFFTKIFLVGVFLLQIHSFKCYAQKNSLSRNEAYALSKKAMENMYNDSFEKSLIESRKALEIAMQLKDNFLIASLYNTIGGNFDGLLDYEKALFYYKKGLIYADKANKNELKKLLHNNIGNIYFFDKKDLKKGVYHYNQAITHSLAIKDTAQVVFTKINMAWAHFDIEKFNEGYPYLAYANQHFKNHGDKSLLCVHNMLNGIYNSFKNKPLNASNYFQKAIQHGIEENELSDLSYAYLEYSKFLNKNKDYKNAFIYLSKYNTLNEELNEEAKIKKANAAGINIEIDEYKREIDQISSTYKTKEIYWNEEHKNHQKTVIVILILSIVILLIFFGYTRFEKLKQLHQNRKIEILNQQNMINATIDGQEMERKKIAAFLHDNISALLSSAGMHLNIFNIEQPNNSQELLKTKKILEEAHQKVRDLSHELIPSLLVRFGIVYALEDLCEKNSNSNISIEFEQIVKTPLQLEETLELKIYFMVSELINNIIKHSNGNRAKVSIKTDSSVLEIEVKDNGKGFEQQDQLINEGYGLNRIKARISNIKGTITILSSLKEGTAVQLSIPLV